MADNGLDVESHRRLTARPRLYGFHATLKAPLRLAQAETHRSLADAIAGLASRFSPMQLPPLRVDRIGSFLALVPSERSADLDALAAACTMDLDRFRAPLSDAEYQRRRPERLSSRQRDFLRSWGYPYVLEEYRWHMTLTGRLDDRSAGPLRQSLKQAYTSICSDEAVVIDDLSLVYQPTLDKPFELVSRTSLGP